MTDELAERFETHRPRLTALAHRMLGVRSDADDAVQETWLRLERAGGADIENLGGWLTTVTARVCLNMLRSRRGDADRWLDPRVPDPVVERGGAGDAEHHALLADSVGLALLVVLDTLTPTERVAFVLHDVFALPFDDIAPIVDRTPDATRQLASRARRRVQGAAVPDTDRARQREVVDAFFAAARRGDLDALVSVLHPDVVVRSDGGSARPVATGVVRGAAAVAGRATTYANPDAVVTHVRVDGGVGVLVEIGGVPTSIMTFTVVAGRIRAIDALVDPDRLVRLGPRGT